MVIKHGVMDWNGVFTMMSAMDLVSVFVRILEMITIIRKQNVLIDGISPIDMVSMVSGHVCDMNVFEVHTFTNIDLYYDR